MPVDPNARLLAQAAVLLLWASALAAACELLARQAPGSALYLGVLPGPIAGLRELSMTLGLLLLGAVVLCRPGLAGALPAWLARALAFAAGLAVAAQAYGALHGMYAIQLQDLRADALPAFVLKHLGLLGFGLSYVALGLRVLRPAVGEPGVPPT